MNSFKFNILSIITFIALGVTVLFLISSCKKGDYFPKGEVDKEAASHISFYETYSLSELFDALTELSQEDAKHRTDTLSFALFTGFEVLADTQADMPVVGYVAISDTAAVNSIIAQYGTQVLPSDIKFAWVFKPIKMLSGDECCELIALRTLNGEPQMTGKSINQAWCEYNDSTGYVVVLKFDEEGGREFSVLSRHNIGQSIALVLNDRVIVYPRVNAAVNEGLIQIDTSITDGEDAINFVDYIYGKKNLFL